MRNDHSLIHHDGARPQLKMRFPGQGNLQVGLVGGVVGNIQGIGEDPGLLGCETHLKRCRLPGSENQATWGVIDLKMLRFAADGNSADRDGSGPRIAEGHILPVRFPVGRDEAEIQCGIGEQADRFDAEFGQIGAGSSRSG